MFGSKSREERSKRLGIKITLWDDIKVHTEVFSRWLYNVLFPTKKILIDMHGSMIRHFGSPDRAYKYIKDSGIVKVRRGWNKITVWAKRPGIFIGAKGKELKYLEKKLGKKILVKEYTKMTAIDKAYEHMEFCCAYYDNY